MRGVHVCCSPKFLIGHISIVSVVSQSVSHLVGECIVTLVNVVSHSSSSGVRSSWLFCLVSTIAMSAGQLRLASCNYF